MLYKKLKITENACNDIQIPCSKNIRTDISDLLKIKCVSKNNGNKWLWKKALKNLKL